MQYIVDAGDVVFRYSGSDKNALDHMSLKVKRGELVAVLGANGSGKSTFAKHLNSILLPVGGVCYVGGIDTADEEKLMELRRTAGMVFQNPDNQIVATIVEEDVAFGLENLGVPSGEIRNRVDEALKCVGMYEYRKHAPHQLSGGQKQRIAIAGIIAMRPQLIILDEPTAMLDPRGRREVMNAVLDINKRENITVMLITHYMEEAAACTRVVVMDKGRVLLDSTPRDVFSNVRLLREKGLDVPQAAQLAYELKIRGIDIGSGIITAEECVEAVASLLDKGVGA